MKYLASTRKWALFITISSAIIFIIVGLSIVFMMTVTPIESNGFSMGMGSSLFIMLIYLIPLYFLFRFSTTMKKALAEFSSSELTKAFDFLQRHYLVSGIILLLVLALYAVIVVFMMLMSSSGMNPFSA